MKRILLFLITNLAVIVVLSITMRILGIDQYIAAQGGSLYGLLVFAAVFGFGGAFISLAMSKWSAKRMMGVQIIQEPRNTDERWLVDTVRKLSSAISACPRSASSTRLSPMPLPPAPIKTRR